MHTVEIKKEWMLRARDRAVLRPDQREAITEFVRPQTNIHTFDLVLADPPYGEKNLTRRSQSFAQKVLDDAHLPGLLAVDGLLVLGHARRDRLELPSTWRERKTLKHGDSIFLLLTPASPPAADAAPESGTTAPPS